MLGYSTTPKQSVLGAGDPPPVPARLTPVAQTPKGRWFLGSLVLALVGVGAHRLWNAFLRYQAYGVVIGREVQVSPPWNGEVEAVHVREGDKVRQGDLLCSLSNLELAQDRTRLQDELRIAQADLSAELARARLDENEQRERTHKSLAEYYAAWAELLEEQTHADMLQQSLERQLKLFQSAIISEESFAELREQASGQTDKVDQLRRALEELRERADLDSSGTGAERLRPFALRIELLQSDLERLAARAQQGELRAPVNGTIVRRECFVGEQASMERALLWILDEGSEEIQLFVSQQQAATLAPGQELVLEVEPNAQPVHCRVVALGDAYTLPPPGVGRFTIPGEMFLPVRLQPLHAAEDALILRIGALAKLPRPAS